MATPADPPQREPRPDPDDEAPDLDDRLDEALKAMWQGRSGPLDKILGVRAARASGVGTILRDLMQLPQESVRAHGLPERIGQYRILGLLGAGGMGVVYEAEQEHPKRTVALKVVSGPVAGAAHAHTARLFHREMQTLARLEHPCIATIHEAGCTEQGQQFFVMELVHGLPLHQYVRTTDPPLRDRLLLFQRICHAIHYAHQRGVIHRDLKPSNILVDAEGNPKVLDFGLAKITDSDVTVTTIETEVGKIQGTLPYMSPEQARGDPREINLLSDVYALGVILYELLTGKLPYEVQRTMLPEALRVICEAAPRRPSSIRRALRGDLETVALKALEKEPTRRYQSAAALAEDIDHYLTQQPILARPPTTAYLLRKLIARHKVPCTFLVALFLSVTASAIWMGLLYRQSNRLRRTAEVARAAEQTQRELAEARLVQAEEARGEARAAASTSERITRFLQDMLAAADPERSPVRDVTVREILDQAGQTVHLALNDEPEVELGVRFVIGASYLSLGRFSDAEAHFRAALAIAEALPGAESTQAGRRGRIMRNLGNALAHDDDFAEAETTLMEAIRILRETLGDDHVDTIAGRIQLGVLRWKQGRYADAEMLLQDSVERSRRVHGDDHRETIAALNILALILNDAGRHGDAEPLLRKALDWSLQTLGTEHPQTARAYNNLAWNLQQSGKYAESESLYRRALESWDATQAKDHPEAALCRENLGLILNVQGRFDEAEPLFRAALKSDLQTLGETHTQTAGSYIGLAWSLYELAQHTEAEAAIEKAQAILERLPGGPHQLSSRCFEVKGRGLNLQGKFEEAELTIRKALEIGINHVGEDHPDTLRLYNELAFTLSKQGKLHEAEVLFRQALVAYERRLGMEHPGTLIPKHNLASILERQGKTDDAAAIYREVIQLAEKVLPEGHVNTCLFRGALGNCLTALGDYEEAEQHLLTAYEGLKAALGEDHLRTRNARAKLETLYAVWKTPTETGKDGRAGCASRKCHRSVSKPDESQGIGGVSHGAGSN